MRLSEITQTTVDWIWPNYLARGMFTLFEGDPGVGKGLLSIDIAARLTRGWPLPGEEGYLLPIEQRVPIREPVAVLLMTTEDSCSRTEAPRAEVAGADLARISKTGGVQTLGRTLEEMARSLTGIMEIMMDENDIRYIHMDPIEDILPGFTTYDAASVRTAITVFNEFARRKDLAYSGSRHLNKLGRGRAIYRGRGSIALTAAARFAYSLSTYSPSTLPTAHCPLPAPYSLLPTAPNLHILACIKNNLAERPFSLAFRIVPVQHGGQSIPRIEWVGPVDLTADDLIAPPRPRRLPATTVARDWLAGLLANGPLLEESITAAAAEAGISPNSLKNAKRLLEVCSRKSGFVRRAQWTWSLPKGENEQRGV